jgi:putative membrane protein
MKLILRILITAALVMVISYFMKGVVVDQFTTAIIVAIVLGLLNLFVKPVLVLLTLPVTFITLGLFLLVINAVIILLCDHFVDGFDVSSFWTALFFSIILSLSQSLVYQLTGEAK